ncbi:MAG: hypothetical protein V3U60_16295 [Gammaproteobacteria bacterium]
MDDSVFVTLSTPLEYGDNQTADRIEIRCPSFHTASDRQYYDHLKSMLAGILMEMASDATDDEGAEDPGAIQPNVMTYILLSKLGDRFTNEIKAFEKRAHLYCFLDSETPLKDGPLGRLHPDDISLIFGAFTANFILPSLLQLMNGNG